MDPTTPPKLGTCRRQAVGVARCAVRLGFALIVLCSGACRSTPEILWTRLAQIRSDLATSDAALWAPQSVSQFELEFQALMKEMARQRARYAFCRDEDELADLSRRILALQAEGRRILAVSRELSRLKKEALEIEAAELMKVIGPRLDRVGDPKVRRLGVGLELNLARIRYLVETGDLPAAERLLDQARSEAGALVDQLDGFESRYRDVTAVKEWKAACRKAVSLSSRVGPVVLVDKYARCLKVLDRGRVKAVFDVDLGWNGFEDKVFEGDGATPEGEYKVTALKKGAQTKYYLALLLSYPNEEDRERFRKMKARGELGPGVRIGNFIEIHGQGGRGRDWTDGCIALDNDDMEQLFSMAYVGMPVVIVGTCGEDCGR